jgi:Protein kinase domain
MTPERFRQVRNLFDAAVEREAPARSAFLAEACQGDQALHEEVGRLLAAHERETASIDHPAARPELLSGEPGKMEGRRIDRYEILRQLGCGGMGSVYLAVRTDDVYRKPVAFKVVRPEASSQEVIERFRQERQILASLDHPNLARLLDGGTTPEGLPYFVMDYIEGKPIDVYCDERRLDIAQRLQLFRAVCAAVEYAHGKGVVHRDLKPSNVLVTAEGMVKLLDFGIAKMLRSDGDESTALVMTRAGMQLMTPEYASPEQVRGDAVGTATDIYSLGVILYELLTGHRPYRMRSRLIHEIVRVICEEEPTRPSTAVTEVEEQQATGSEKPMAVTPQSVSRARADSPAGLRRQLSGDLDRIVLKALRKGPEQRYRTAEAFGEDVRRHLEGLPVAARGENVLYRAGKLLGRYRGWLLAATALGVGLVTGAIQLSPVAIGFLVAFLTLLLFGYVEISQKIGESFASRWLFWLAAGTAAFSLVTMTVVFPDLKQGPYLQVLNLDQEFFAIMVAAIAMGFGFSLIRWLQRDRWDGPLLLDISPKGSRKWRILRVAVLLCLGAGFFGVASLRGAIVLLWLSYIPQALFRGQTELRPQGIFSLLSTIRWSRIQSYQWTRSGNDFTLEVAPRSKGWLGSFRTTRIRVPADKMTAADAILRSHLANWPESDVPAGSDVNLPSTATADPEAIYDDPFRLQTSPVLHASEPEELAEYDARCPKCDSREIVFQNVSAEGVKSPSANPKFNWTCGSCGHQWQDEGYEERK